jgi:hypothetical protein
VENIRVVDNSLLLKYITILGATLWHELGIVSENG